MNTPINLLVIEDNQADFRLITRHLQLHGLSARCHCVGNLEELKAALEEGGWDAVLSDYNVPKLEFHDTLGLFQARHPDLPLILVSGSVGEERAVELLKLGVWDFVLKDSLGRLVPAIERSLRDAADRRARQTAEIALRESEEKFRGLFEGTQDAIMILEPPSWKFTSGNPAAMKMFGAKDEAEFISHGPWELSPDRQPDGRASAESSRTMIETAMREGSHFFEWIHRRIGGEQFPADVLLSRMEQGGKVVIQAIVRDITARKLAAEKIREQAQLLDKANEAIYVRSLSGVISYWNEGADRLYGWTGDEVVGRKIADLNLREAAETADINSLLLAKGDWSGERRSVTKTGQSVVVFARRTLVRDATGQPVSVLAIDTDITEKKQLEVRFMHAQRLENLGALASGLAHDLNNVLGPILMASELLRENAKTDSERNMLTMMEACARRGAGIIRQVLTFARGIEGKRIPLQARHLLREIVGIASETFPKNIELELDADKDLWPVIGDATQLHQVLMNLCVNARDAMPDGGKIALSAANIDLDDAFVVMTPGAKVGPYVRLSLCDTGTGIAPEHKDKIFDPFYTTKAPGKGTGLGLSTVLGIVKNHGGFIHLESEVGRGTCFEVYLPAVLDAKPVVEPGSRLHLPRGQGQLILVVDDEIAIRTVASKILERSGYRTVSASDGTEAIAVFMQNRAAIAAMITDMLMPGMDGPALVRIARRIDPELRIIGISGVGEGTTIDVINSLGVSALLTKPFTGNSLLFTLDAVLKAQPGTRVEHSASP